MDGLPARFVQLFRDGWVEALDFATTVEPGLAPLYRLVGELDLRERSWVRDTWSTWPRSFEAARPGDAHAHRPPPAARTRDMCQDWFRRAEPPDVSLRVRRRGSFCRIAVRIRKPIVNPAAADAAIPPHDGRT